jgi:hypothetical protein
MLLLKTNEHNLIYDLFLTHIINIGYYNSFFDHLSSCFHQNPNLKFVKLLIFIITFINPSIENDFFDSYLTSDVQVQMIKYSDESDDEFRNFLASHFHLFLSSMLQNETFYSEKFCSATAYLLSHQYYDLFFPSLEQFFNVDSGQLSHLVLRQIIELYIQIFQYALQFHFKESLYCLLVKKLTESMYFWTHHFFDEIDTLIIAISNLASYHQSSMLYEELLTFTLQLSMNYKDKFHILPKTNLKPNKNIVNYIKQLIVLNS